MLRPYPWSWSRSPRRRCAVDAWAGPGWTLLERHEVPVAAPAATALAAAGGLRIRELPAVRALFSLRRLSHTADMTLRTFFSTPPFVLLAEDPGREVVFGVLRPPAGSGRAAGAPSPDAFRRALRTAPFAGVVTFRADARDPGATLWTETWVRTRGVRAGAAFAAYWLAVGPWSAWIRRIILRAARARAEREVAPAREAASG